MGNDTVELSINHPAKENRQLTENNIANKTINATSRRMSNKIGFESSTVYGEFTALEEGTLANLAGRLGEIQKDRDSNLTEGMEVWSIKKSNPSQESIAELSTKKLRKKAGLELMMKNHSFLENPQESSSGKSLDLSNDEVAKVASIVSSGSDVEESPRELEDSKPNSSVETHTQDYAEGEKFRDQSHQLLELTSNDNLDKQVSTEISVEYKKTSSEEKTGFYQVPASLEKNESQMRDEGRKVSTGEKEHLRKTLDSIEHQSTRKNQGSKSQNEFLNGKGGSFHEIKSSRVINIHHEANQLILSGKIVQPKISSPLGKYTPYFEDGEEDENVTARIGNTVLLDCKIGMLSNKTVRILL